MLSNIEMRHIRMDLKSPFRTSFGVEQERDCLIIRLEGDGIEGWGECVAGDRPGYSYETTGTAWHILAEFLIPAVLENPPASIDALLACFSGIKGHPQARACLEMAYWDFLGKRQGLSLRRMLGGLKDRIPVGVSIGIQDSPALMIERVESYLRQGYARIKLKIEPGNDLQVVEAVRAAYPGIALQVDANAAYNTTDHDHLLKLDPFELELVEQPYAEDDLIDHAELQKDLQTPVCLDESILSRRHARQALQIDACRVINIKPARVGGLSEGVAIHDLCLAKDIPVWCGGMLETGIGRASNLAIASLPGFTLHSDISASERYYQRDIAHPLFELNPDSTINVPDAPGLGVEVDREALELFTLRYQDFKH